MVEECQGKEKVLMGCFLMMMGRRRGAELGDGWLARAAAGLKAAAGQMQESKTAR
jgi:hypothetical protein